MDQGEDKPPARTSDSKTRETNSMTQEDSNPGERSNRIVLRDIEEVDVNNSGLGERETIPDLGEFVKLFRFYFNRQFSCAVPKNIIVKITPFKRDNSNDQAISIGSGIHRQLMYSLPMVRKIEILEKID